MVSKYAYAIPSNLECTEGETFISCCKLSSIEVMKLMMDKKAKYGCIVFDTKGSDNEDDWERLSFFSPLEYDF